MKLPDWRKLVSRKRKQTPGWKNFVSAMRNLIPNREKLASVGRKFVPGRNKGKYCAQGPALNWKTTLHKALPYVLVVVFALATFASVVGVNSTNTDFISLQGTKNELETQKQALYTSQQELEGVLNETKTLLGQLTALNSDMQELLEKAEVEGGAVSDKIDQLQNALQTLGSTYAVAVISYVTEQEDAVVFFDFIKNFLFDFSVHSASPDIASKSASIAIAVSLSATVAPLALA